MKQSFRAVVVLLRCVTSPVEVLTWHLEVGSFTVGVGVRVLVDIVGVIGVRLAGGDRRLGTAQLTVGATLWLGEGVLIPNNLGICVMEWPKPP